MSIPENLVTLINKHGLNPMERELIASAKPSIRLLPRLGEPIKTGSTKIGGKPDTAMATWPRTPKGRPLCFLAQLGLEDIQRPWNADILPSQGVLQFFYDVENQPWGEFKEQGLWLVQHSLPGATECDGPTLGRECGVTLRDELTFPSTRSIELDRLPFGECDADDVTWNSYLDFREAAAGLVSDSPEITRAFGHPDAIQGCMQRTIQFESRNEKLPKNVYSYYEHPRAQELIPGAFDWQLLFQLDSISDLDLMWGDDGRVYFWITKSDLAAHRFDRAWATLQCY